MTVPSDLPLSTTEPANSASPSRFDSFLSFPGRDLAFIQDGVGHYLSFYWREAEQYELCLEHLIGQPMNQVFAPVLFPQYLERVRQVIDSLVPVQFEYAFVLANRYFVFDLIV
ncbi:histidine kinase, partial [filamentous cyanobacterium CCP1]